MRKFREKIETALKPFDTFGVYRVGNNGRSSRLMVQHSQDSFGTPSVMLASDDVAKSRHESRDSLFLTGDFHIVGDPNNHNVRIRNLSAGGLMAEFDRPLATGTEVQCDIRGIGSISGKIAWCAAGRVGVAFDDQIDPLLARRPVGRRRAVISSVKPVLTRS